METITGRSNQHLKFARQVRDNKVAGKFFVEGKRLSDELLRSNITTETVFVTEDFAALNKDSLSFFDKAHADIYLLSENLHNSISGTKSPQGISVVCKTPEHRLDDLAKKVSSSQNQIVLLLHQISNPGNLGAILRSAEAFGVVGVIITENSSNPFSPAAVRGSMGSVFRLPVIGNIDFQTALDWAKNTGMRTVCADVNADTVLETMDWSPNTLLVLGSEAHGLKESERRQIDLDFKINMKNRVESLNLAVAAGVVLYSASAKPKTT